MTIIIVVVITVKCDLPVEITRFECLCRVFAGLTRNKYNIL